MCESSMATGKVAFVRMASRPIPRVTRMMQVFEECGFETVFIGAFRESGLARDDTWEERKVLRVGGFFPLLNGRRPFLYAKSIFGFGRAAYSTLKRLRPKAVHVSDFEASIPVLLFARIHRVPVIYNIHDNLAQRYRLPRVVSWLLNCLEGVAVRAASVTLVPETFRRDALPVWCRPKVTVVRNTPIDPGYADPSALERAELRRLMFAGWLDWGRGLRELIELVEAAPGFSLSLAGEGDQEVWAFAEKHAHVRWLGFLSHSEVIDITRRCGFVTALYDPARPINRYAASNKIAEGLALGRPLIVNSELEIVKTLRPFGCILEVPYHEVAHLVPQLKRLADDTEAYRAMSVAARSAYEDLFDWKLVRRHAERVVRDVMQEEAA